MALGCGKKVDKGSGSKPVADPPPGPVIPPTGGPGAKADPSGLPPTGAVHSPPTEPDAWPALPVVPPKAATYPNTAGGRVARALDYAADQFVTAPKPPDNVLWADWFVVTSFKDIGTGLIPTYPRRVLAQQPDMVVGPAGDATADRALIDASFVRVLAGWNHFRERSRRWNVAISEVAIQKQKPGATPRQSREEAERMYRPGREVRVGTKELGRPATAAYDWVVLDASGDSGGTTIKMGETMSVGGRID